MRQAPHVPGGDRNQLFWSQACSGMAGRATMRSMHLAGGHKKTEDTPPGLTSTEAGIKPLPMPSLIRPSSTRAAPTMAVCMQESATYMRTKNLGPLLQGQHPQVAGVMEEDPWAKKGETKLFYTASTSSAL